MSALISQRCVLHEMREAAVRCPACKAYFCRECVVEHDGRMMCARCVANIATQTQRSGSSLLLWGALALAGLLFSWLVFYYVGVGLAHIPSSFHSGGSE